MAADEAYLTVDCRSFNVYCDRSYDSARYYCRRDLVISSMITLNIPRCLLTMPSPLQNRSRNDNNCHVSADAASIDRSGYQHQDRPDYDYKHVSLLISMLCPVNLSPFCILQRCVMRLGEPHASRSSRSR